MPSNRAYRTKVDPNSRRLLSIMSGGVKETVNELLASLLGMPYDPKNRHRYAQSVPLQAENSRVRFEIDFTNTKARRRDSDVIRQVPILKKTLCHFRYSLSSNDNALTSSEAYR